MSKIISVLLSIVVFFSLFCSCSRTTQMQDRAIIEAVAIDYKNGEYIINLKEHSQSDNGGEKEKNNIIKSSGKTLFDALKNAESSDGKQIFYGHSGIFLIGKNAANNGMQSIFDFMNSNYQISLNASVLCCASNAEKVLTSEKFSQTDTNLSIDRIEERGKSVDVTVIDALKNSYNSGGQFYLPLVSISEEDGIKIEKCVVFKDYKPKTKLTGNETMGLNLILENVHDGVFVTEQNGKTISVDVVNENCDIDIVSSDGKASVNISITAYGNVSELGTMGDENTRKTQLVNVENDIEKQIIKAVSSVLYKTATLNKCDVFSLTQRIKKADQKLFEKINESSLSTVLSNMNFSVTADFSIRHSGIQVK